ncbi:hypothetical protein ACH5RR_029818 [Cinchona calisaya]|uniref:S-adenosylmethionine-dependent methyltransferase n=1 Tax=Cinchona calisaya TaxID=153742 RepID=A0ABD2YST9_9GENT
MASNNTASLPKSFSMNGGNGSYSYSNNSTVQRIASMTAEAMIEEVIGDSLDIEKFSTPLNTLRIADLGCSVGPNTYIAMQYIIGAIEKKCISKGLSRSQLPDFQVFFNDQPTNDFNTLFTFIPPEKQYFVAAVPGSFHGQLFPKFSIYIVYSSFAFHWLSEVPKEVLIKHSPAWNKGRIFYNSASKEVAEAYASQFAKDIDSILKARAKEIIRGGMMISLLIAVPDGYDNSKIGVGLLYDALGSSLLDMAHEGLINADLVDTFNVPMYVTCPKEMERLIKNNDCFSIERLKLLEYESDVDGPLDTRKHVIHIRAALECMITAHFGNEIIDELFDRLDQKATVYRHLDASYRKGHLLFLALKRQ